MDKSTLVQTHINKLQMIIDQLTNIDHQISNENLAFTFFRNLPPSFHTLMVSLGTHIDQLFMELVCGKLLQKELRCKQQVQFNHGIRHETLTIKGVLGESTLCPPKIVIT
jgi:hypothetical protein